LALTNPRVTFGIGFVDDFEDGNGSISLTFCQSTGVGRADESTRHLSKLFR
jgi:hypothetical protein